MKYLLVIYAFHSMTIVGVDSKAQCEQVYNDIYQAGTWVMKQPYACIEIKRGKE